MRKRLLAIAYALFAIVLGGFPESVRAQATADPSGEPYVFELSQRAYRFEADGTGRSVNDTRIRVQNETGVQQLGQLLFSYVAGRDRLKLEYLRVRRPDGSVTESSADLVQDLPAPVTAQFPIYSDLRILHVTVPSFRPGDVIEYRLVSHLDEPDAPNRFWMADAFERLAVVLDERIEVDVPVSEPIRLHVAEGLEPEVHESGGRRIYRWARTGPAPESSESDAAGTRPGSAEPERLLDIELSNFCDWQDVGAWYVGLQGKRAMPDKAIRRQAQDLIVGLDDDRSRIKAIYRYVATEFRYLALLFGAGRYQPNPASTVLRNGYGDCKDKHTLLAALLAAAGLRSSPVLIGTLNKFNEDVPSLTSLDHVITAVHLDGDLLLLDSTQSLPFGYLDPALRGRQALLVPEGEAARLVTVPDHLPFANSQVFSLVGEIDDTGHLHATIYFSFRGDDEALLRMAFLNSPKSEWQNLAAFFNKGLRLEGEISDLEVSDPTAIEQPFQLSYTLKSPDMINLYRQSQDLELPRPPVELSEAPKEATAEPMELGELLTRESRIELTVPAGFESRAPVAVQIDRDFASFASSYSVTDRRLLAERRIVVKEHRLAPERFREWAALRTTAMADAKQTFALHRSEQSASALAESTDVAALYEAGKNAAKAKDHETAASLFSRVVELEPEHATAWYSLGMARVKSGQAEDGIEALRRQIEVDPFHEGVHSNLGWALEKIGNRAGAEAAHRAQLERYPLDHYSNARLGELLDEGERCAEAVAFLDSALSIDSDDHGSRMRLGRCYLRLERRQEGLATLEPLTASSKVWILYSAGYAAMEHSAYDTAIRLLRRVTELDSSHVHAFNNLGRALFAQGRLEEAEGALRRLVEIEPNDPLAHYELARTLMERNQPSQAIAPARRHLEIVPDDTAALHLLAMVLWADQQRPDAADALRRLIELDPEYPAVYNMLGVLLFQSDRIDEAAEALDKALAIDTEDFDANHTLGVIRARQERNAEALRLLEKARAIAPEHFTYQDMLDYVREKVETGG